MKKVWFHIKQLPKYILFLFLFFIAIRILLFLLELIYTIGLALLYKTNEILEYVLWFNENNPQISMAVIGIIIVVFIFRKRIYKLLRFVYRQYIITFFFKTTYWSKNKLGYYLLSLIGLGVFDYIINRDFTVLSMITVFIFLINMFLSDTRWYEKQINPCPVCGEGVVTIQERLSEEVAYRCDNCDFKHIIIPGRLKKYEKKDTLSNYIPCQECKNGWMKKHLDKEDNVFFECRNCGNVKEIN